MIDLWIVNGLDSNNHSLSIGIDKGKIVAINTTEDKEAKQLIDLENKFYVSAGWIDAHVHCYKDMELYFDQADKVGVECGVTSIIDAGSTGALNIDAFYESVKYSITNVYALLNISKTGIIHQDELADLNNIDTDLILETLTKYPDFIVGLKARMSSSVVGDNGIIPLQLAKRIQAKTKHLPLMIHIGNAPPTLQDILEELDANDVVTHCFNGKENNILEKNNIRKCVIKAHEKGVLLDVGHGSASFDYTVAKIAYGKGFQSDIISTDIYSHNRVYGPVYNLGSVLSKMMHMGYSHPDIMDSVTSKPARTFHLKCKGDIEIGKDGDLTIYKIENTPKYIEDSKGNKEWIEYHFKPYQTIIGGVVYEVKKSN